MTPPLEENTRSIEDLLDRLADAESRLGSLAGEVEHLQRLSMVGTLAAGIVHEVNNILTPALAEAQIARLRQDDPQRLLAAIDQCILSMTQAARVAESIIAFSLPGQSRCSSAQSPADPPPAANIAQAVKSTLACLGRRPGDQGVRIETHIPPDAWVKIEPLALQQVFLNLFLNSLKVLRDVKGPHIQIAAGPTEDGRTEITFADNGPGIPQSIRENLFEPFTSAATTKRAVKGTGLGLTISRRLVLMAGGSIEAGEHEPQGTRFTIRLASISSSKASKAA